MNDTEEEKNHNYYEQKKIKDKKKKIQVKKIKNIEDKRQK